MLHCTELLNKIAYISRLTHYNACMAVLAYQGEDGEWHLLDRSETVHQNHSNVRA